MAAGSPGYFVAVTDRNWFRFLASKPPMDEVNFWRPSGSIWHLLEGSPFLFKSRSPEHTIIGGGFVSISQKMPLRETWEFFGEKNGAENLWELMQLIQGHSREAVTVNTTLGCMILSAPFFLGPDQQFEVPKTWRSKNTPGFKTNEHDPEATAVWTHVKSMLGSALPPLALSPFGGTAKPAFYLPRLGQGAFRSLVLTAYQNRCAISGERTLPVIEAAHITDFAETRSHEITNGIALRADIHKLFARGYVSVRPDHRFVVSKTLTEEFHNGKIYYELDGRTIQLPADTRFRPKQEYLERHYEERFRR